MPDMSAPVIEKLCCKMKIKHILIATVAHFCLFLVFCVLGLGATMGLGFKDELSTFGEIYTFISLNGLKILAGFGWFFFDYFIERNDIIQWAFIGLNSLVHGTFFLWIYNKCLRKNAT